MQPRHQRPFIEILWVRAAQKRADRRQLVSGASQRNQLLASSRFPNRLLCFSRYLPGCLLLLPCYFSTGLLSCLLLLSCDLSSCLLCLSGGFSGRTLLLSCRLLYFSPNFSLGRPGCCFLLGHDKSSAIRVAVARLRWVVNAPTPTQ